MLVYSVKCDIVCIVLRWICTFIAIYIKVKGKYEECAKPDIYIHIFYHKGEGNREKKKVQTSREK